MNCTLYELDGTLTHTQTDTDVRVHTYTRGKEVRSTTIHPTLADTRILKHTHETVSYGWTDGESDWNKRKEQAARQKQHSLRHNFSSFRFQPVKDWTDRLDGRMFMEKCWGSL